MTGHIVERRPPRRRFPLTPEGMLAGVLLVVLAGGLAGVVTIALLRVLGGAR